MSIFLIIVILTVIGTLLVGGIFYWIEKWGIDTLYIESFIPWIFVGLIVFIYNISYKLSYKIYEKKEF